MATYKIALVIVAAVLVAAGIGLAWLIRPFEPVRVEVVQDGLEHPWDIAFADDGRMLVTERIGRVLVFASGESNADLLSTTTIPDVRAELESGLMGIAIHDDAVFICASRDPGDDWRVELLRSTLADDGSLAPFEVVPIGEITGAPRHQGCAVEVDATDHLWLSVGDANLPAGENRAQDPDRLNGKVLRLNLDGSVPADNPFESPVYSLGHRNPQGLAFGPDGTAWEVEHGTDENDEINHLQAGGNYGYPCFTGADAPGPIPDGCGAASEYLPPAWASGYAHPRHVGRDVPVGRRLGRLGGSARRQHAQGRGPATVLGGLGRQRHARGDAARRPVRPAASGGHRSRWRALRVDLERHGRPHPPGHPLGLTDPGSYQRRTRRARSVFQRLGPAIAVLELEVDRAGMGVLQEPRAIRLLLGSDQLDRFVHARVRRITSRPEMLQAAQDVVVPAGRKRELQPGGVDDGAAALAPEELPFQEVFLSSAASRDGLRRAAGCAFVRQQPLQDPDRRVEGRANRAVLHLAVPAAILELLADEPSDDRIHVLVEVGTQRDDHSVDARLDLALEERLAGMLPTRVLPDLRDRPAHPVRLLESMPKSCR